MKKQNATLQDIASAAGVSLATAHLVLAQKPGPKTETRERVLHIARSLDYHCNSVASSLKRGTTRIVAVLPAATARGTLFHEPIWNGVRAYCDYVKDFHMELIEIPYVNPDSISVPLEAVERIQSLDKISGMIVPGDIENDAKAALRDLTNREIPLVLVNSDAPETGRFCCVQANNYLLGKVMGEILCSHIADGSGILVCAGYPNTPANYQSVRGIEDFFRGRGLCPKIIKIHHKDNMNALYQALREQFSTGTIGGCCSVTARGSVQLAHALQEEGLAGKLSAIGSDLFSENIRNIKNGTFQYLMFKNPYQQGWLAAEQLFKYIFHRQRPGNSESYVKGEVIFQSSVSLYESELEQLEDTMEVRAAANR